MYGEQHLSIDVFGFVSCKTLVKKLDSDIGGNALISARKNGMLLPVDRTEALMR